MGALEKSEGVRLMVQTIKAGTVLIKEGVVLPDSLQIESEPYSKGWRLVQNLDGGGLDRKAQEAGWTLFFMAGEIRSTVLGSDSEGSAGRAVDKLTTKMNGFNCLEISQVAGSRTLGLPSVTASGHARHIQQSMFLVEHKQPVNGLGG
jgi:hypothetical protein